MTSRATISITARQRIILLEVCTSSKHHNAAATDGNDLHSEFVFPSSTRSSSSAIQGILQTTSSKCNFSYSLRMSEPIRYYSFHAYQIYLCYWIVSFKKNYSPDRPRRGFSLSATYIPPLDSQPWSFTLFFPSTQRSNWSITYGYFGYFRHYVFVFRSDPTQIKNLLLVTQSSLKYFQKRTCISI